jgi:hypothetical protein
MMTAQNLSQQLGGHWYGRYGTAPCPICQTERRKDQNALTLSDNENRLLAHCKKSGCDFHDIVAAAGLTHGKWKAPNLVETAQRKAQAKEEANRRSLQAQRLWSETWPIAGSLAEQYLRQRAITCELPDTLRFHPECWHPSAKRLPAMLSVVEGAAGFALHRTYLMQDGSGKAQVEPPKAMLGNVSGGAVRLAKASGPLVVAEGIETALSLCCGLLNGPATVWAALSTAGLVSLKLPPKVGKLVIAADNDKAGHRAANDLATKASQIGWEVTLSPPESGADWNIVLRGMGQ